MEAHMRIPHILLIALLLSACTPRLVQAPNPTPIRPNQTSPTVISTTDLVAEQVSQLAIKDLSARLDMDPSTVNILSIESTLWPDTALGCPRPGEGYVQQTVPGYQLVLEVNGQEYVYHTDSNQTVILCPEEALPSFPVTPGEIDDGQPWMPVD
jgi:hypothetical protein